MTSNESVCCQGESVAFFWRECNTSKHIDAAASACLAALAVKRPKISEIQEAFARARIVNRITRASQGKLRRPEEVKHIQSQPVVTMFEMRWDNLPFAQYDAFGKIIAAKAPASVRLYYVEQPSTGKWALGLYAHEKEFLTKTDAHGDIVDDPDATRDLQNEHIEKAAEVLNAGAKNHCGVTGLDKYIGADPLITPSQVR